LEEPFWTTFGDIPSNFSKENLQEDIDNLYAMGVSIASAGANNLINSILGNSNFSGTIMDKTASVIEIAENVYNLYDEHNDQYRWYFA
jgi:hypothetical protein